MIGHQPVGLGLFGGIDSGLYLVQLYLRKDIRERSVGGVKGGVKGRNYTVRELSWVRLCGR
jgi:hypothetical protein